MPNDDDKRLISIEPFKVSIVQIVTAVFVAGMLWAGYQALSKSVADLTATMKTINNTMLVLSTNRDNDKKILNWLLKKTDEIQDQESSIVGTLERHESEIETLKKKAGL